MPVSSPTKHKSTDDAEDVTNPTYTGPEAKCPPPTLSVLQQSASFVREDGRKCRDVLFAILFIIFWLGMLVVGGIALTNGDPAALVYGLDYTGRLCDSDGDGFSLKGFEARMWPNAAELAQAETNYVDVDYKNVELDFNLETFLADAKSLCVKECPQPTNVTGQLKWVCNYPQNSSLASSLSVAEWGDQEYDYFSALTVEEKRASYKFKGPCWPLLIKSANQYDSCQYFGPVVNTSYDRWLTGECLTDATKSKSDCGSTQWASGIPLDPEAAKKVETSIKRNVNAAGHVLERAIADLGKAWIVCLICGAILPVVLSFSWLIVMRYAAGFMAWLTVIFTNLLMIAFTLVLFVKAGVIGSSEIDAIAGDGFTDSLPDELDAADENRTTLTIVAVISAVCTLILLIVCIFMIPRIKIAVATLKVATQAVATVPSVAVFPALPFFMLFVLGAYWLPTAVYLLASGDVTQRGPKSEGGTCDIDTDFCGDGGDTCMCGYEIAFSQTLKYMVLYHFFGLLWTVQFIYGFAMTTIAGAISYFYWTRGDASRVPDKPLMTSMRRTCSYHLGSVCLGALIIAIIQFIRAILAYLDRKMKKVQSDPVKFIMFMVHSCLWCTEKIVMFLSRNAYIMIAIDGENFCNSALTAAKLLTNNILRIAAVNTVGDAILFLGKLGVAIMCSLLAFWMMDAEKYKSGHEAISQPLVPVAFVVFMSFMVASVFMAVMEMAVDTIILSFCLDCEEHDGTPEYAPPLLVEALDLAKKDQDKKKKASDRTGH